MTSQFDKYEGADIVKQRVYAAWCAFIRDIQPQPKPPKPVYRVKAWSDKPGITKEKAAWILANMPLQWPSAGVGGLKLRRYMERKDGSPPPPPSGPPIMIVTLSGRVVSQAEIDAYKLAYEKNNR